MTAIRVAGVDEAGHSRDHFVFPDVDETDFMQAGAQPAWRH